MRQATATAETNEVTHRRLRHLPPTCVLGREVPVARSRRSRLLGLARLDACEAGPGLLIENCRSVHTFGMRFPLDLVFLDQRRRPLTVHRAVGPRRVLGNLRAAHVVEFPSRSVCSVRRGEA